MRWRLEHLLHKHAHFHNTKDTKVTKYLYENFWFFVTFVSFMLMVLTPRRC
jgi:hypothetical protein